MMLKLAAFVSGAILLFASGVLTQRFFPDLLF
jgi:hypothetical protein